MGTTEWTVVILVVGARLFLPLPIPYFPLPALLACMILDSVDQSIFQQFPAIPLEGYQSYDKSLDIYYLAIIYISTMRNWTNQCAFRMSWFLYYYRLVGVVAFELTQVRAILFIFPNTFEYFFVFVEAVRLRLGHRAHGQVDGDPLRGPHLDLHQAAAGVVDPHRPARHDRLHQGDAVRRERRRDSWGDGDRQPAVGAGRWRSRSCVAIVAIGYWIITRKAPPGDHGPGSRPTRCRPSARRRAVPHGQAPRSIFDWALLEKVVLTASSA